MSGFTEVGIGPGGMWVYGAFYSTPSDADPQQLQSLLYAFSSVWSYPEFWRPIDPAATPHRAVMWNPARSDAPPDFKAYPARASQFTPSTPEVFDFNINLCRGSDTILYLAHELGHRYQRRYDAWGKDDAAQLVQEIGRRGGADSMEKMAGAIGDVWLRRLGMSVRPIDGMDAAMEALRVARLT